MSVQGVAWAWSRKEAADAAGLTVLMALGNLADTDGFVAPVAQFDVGLRARVARSTVGRKIREFEEAGLLQVLHRRNEDGGNDTAAYFLRIHDGLSFTAYHEKMIATAESESDKAWSETARLLRERLAAWTPTLATRTAPRSGGEAGSEVLHLFDPPVPSKTEDRQPRPRDLAFEALCEVTSFDPRTARGPLNVALKGIRALWADEWHSLVDQTPNQTPTPDTYSVAPGSEGDSALADEIRARGRVLRDRLSKPYAPSALARWWVQLGKEAEQIREIFG